MAKQDEEQYFDKIGEDGRHHALNKPFSDEHCGLYFTDMGMLFSLLPKPPARILDLGVGTGWTSVFLAQRGYEVTGQDISEDGIALANQNKERAGLANLSFIVADYEHLTFANEFDGAVFYDCLHHSEDTHLALSSVYKALKPGGFCVTIEPGTGHAAAEGSVNARKQWGVTEKDMPPKTIVALAEQIGFRDHEVYARLFEPLKIPRRQSAGDHVSLFRRFLEFLPRTSYEGSQVVRLRK